MTSHTVLARPLRQKKAHGPFIVAFAGLIGVRVLPWVLLPFLKSPEQTPANQGDATLRQLKAAGDEQGSPAVWTGLVLAATLMKLTASTDDVVWLLPFVSGERKRRNVPLYLCCMQLVVVIAWCFSTGGSAVLKGILGDDDSAWPLEKILELSSAVLLTLYTVKLFREWWLERHADDDEGAEESQDASERAAEDAPPETHVAEDAVSTETPASDETPGSSEDPPFSSAPEDCAPKSLKTEERAAVPGRSTACNWFLVGPCLSAIFPGISVPSLSAQASDVKDAAIMPQPIGKSEKEQAVETPPRTCDKDQPRRDTALKPDPVGKLAHHHAEKLSMRKLFTISMFGSLDDFAVFVSLMLSGVFQIWQLSLGVLFGSLIVVVVCAGAGRFNCVVELIEKVPLWCIIGAFAIWTYISTFVL